MNLHVIKQKRPWKDDIGDILRGGEYIKCLCTDEIISAHQIVYLPAIRPHTWLALYEIGFGIDNEGFEYKCPWSGNTYYHFMPFLLLAKDVEIYRAERVRRGNTNDYAFDSDWVRRMDLGYKDEDGNPKYTLTPNNVTIAMRGHGYTHSTFPSDGHGRWHLTCLELDNSDLIAGWLWVWYNK